MQRRHFMNMLGLTVLLPLTGKLAFAASLSPGYRRLLVLVELKGGNDGLNTVIPFADPAYYALRPKLAIARDQVLQLNEQAGLHPSLQALMPLWQGKELALVQGVGYPEPNLSHFRSIEIWDTASKSNEYRSDGWLSRVFRASPVPASFAADGIIVGSQALGPLDGGARAIALNNPEAFRRQARLANDTPGKGENSAMSHILKVEADIQQAAGSIQGQFAFQTEFPNTEFGNSLKTTAQVIGSNAHIAVARVTLTGFDTHTNQLNQQGRLLKELAEGLVAFRSAMMELNRWNDTVVMSYAEFGRRPHENNSGGTDHGTANSHFLLGGAVRGGLYGVPPKLDQLEADNLRYGVDFRSLYATVAEGCWGVDATAALGGRFRSLPLIQV